MIKPRVSVVPDEDLHQLNVKMLGQAKQAIVALQGLYGEEPEHQDGYDEQAIRAWAVVRDLIELRDELIEAILKVDPYFQATLI